MFEKIYLTQKYQNVFLWNLFVSFHESLRNSHLLWNLKQTFLVSRCLQERLGERNCFHQKVRMYVPWWKLSRVLHLEFYRWICISWFIHHQCWRILWTSLYLDIICGGRSIHTVEWNFFMVLRILLFFISWGGWWVSYIFTTWSLARLV